MFSLAWLSVMTDRTDKPIHVDINNDTSNILFNDLLVEVMIYPRCGNIK